MTSRLNLIILIILISALHYSGAEAASMTDISGSWTVSTEQTLKVKKFATLSNSILGNIQIANTNDSNGTFAYNLSDNSGSATGTLSLSNNSIVWSYDTGGIQQSETELKDWVNDWASSSGYAISDLSLTISSISYKPLKISKTNNQLSSGKIKIAGYITGIANGAYFNKKFKYKSIINFTSRQPFEMKTWYADSDKDGYGNPNSSAKSHSQPTGFVSNNLDCDDYDSELHPGSTEICGDEIDNNCNKQVDESCDLFTDIQSLKPMDYTSQDKYGCSVSTYGNYAIVGASGKDDNGFEDSGCVYAFYNDGSSWEEEAKLKPSDPQNFKDFGTSVAIYDNTAIVGAMGDNTNGTAAGAAYIFKRSGNTWLQIDKLLPDDGTGNLFGIKVAIYGDYAIVGNHGGIGYVFHYNGQDWIQESKLIPSDISTSTFYSKSVSIFGNYAAIGIFDYNYQNPGASVYIFERNGSGWSQIKKIGVNNYGSDSFFAYSVNLFDDYLLVGSPGDDDVAENSGAVYVFQRVGINWILKTKLKSDLPTRNEALGFGVSMSDEYLSVLSGNQHHNLLRIADNTWQQFIKTKIGNSNNNSIASISDQFLIIGITDYNSSGNVTIYELPD